MNEQPDAEQIARWQRRLASQANNRAWTLAEAASRTSDEDDEMRDAAHAAMYFWAIVGNATHQARAAQLLAHVYGLLKLGQPAERYLEKSRQLFAEDALEPWELAMSQAIAANVAAANGDTTAHRTHYEEAQRLTAALPDPENRNMLETTLRVIAVPR